MVFQDYDFLARWAARQSRPTGLMLPLLEAVRDLVPAGGEATLLDVGGGTNSYLVFVGGGYRKIVCDLEPRSLEGLPGVETRVAALPHTGMPSGMADWVSACQVVEHLSPKDYEAGLQEIARLSRRWVAITAPFYQHLESGLVKCPRCAVLYQCDGHCRAFDLGDIYRLQDFFGGLIRLGFCGVRRSWWLTRMRYRLKKVRFSLRRLGLWDYPRPPFTRCPRCGEEAFHDLAAYRARAEQDRAPKWLVPPPFTRGPVGEHFMAVFDRKALPVCQGGLWGEGGRRRPTR